MQKPPRIKIEKMCPDRRLFVIVCLSVLPSQRKHKVSTQTTRLNDSVFLTDDRVSRSPTLTRRAPVLLPCFVRRLYRVSSDGRYCSKNDRWPGTLQRKHAAKTRPGVYFSRKTVRVCLFDSINRDLFSHAYSWTEYPSHLVYTHTHARARSLFL